MKWLLCLLCLLPLTLMAQQTAERIAQHVAAQRTADLRTLPTDFARAALRYRESFTEGDVHTQAVSRKAVIALMERSVAVQDTAKAKQQTMMLRLFRKYSAGTDANSLEQARQVLADFGKSIEPKAISGSGEVID